MNDDEFMVYMGEHGQGLKIVSVKDGAATFPPPYTVLLPGANILGWLQDKEQWFFNEAPVTWEIA